jgi:hypothetical protein
MSTRVIYFFFIVSLYLFKSITKYYIDLIPRSYYNVKGFVKINSDYIDIEFKDAIENKYDLSFSVWYLFCTIFVCSWVRRVISLTKTCLRSIF